MKLFIDSANYEEIKAANDLGVIEGVTTNPSLIAKEKGTDLKEAIYDITKLISGPVSAEVIGTRADEMVTEGRELAAINANVAVKIPITEEGLKATYRLSREGISINMTLIFSANQALLAARAGARFVSPFVGRLDDIGVDGIGLVADISELFFVHNIEAEIIAASIRHPQHVLQAALVGAHIATVPYRVLLQMLNHPLTDSGLERFLADWEKHKDSLK